MVLWKGMTCLGLVVRLILKVLFTCQAPISLLGGGILSIHRHRADISVWDVAGRGRGGWADWEGAVWDGLSQAEKTEEWVASSKSCIVLCRKQTFGTQFKPAFLPPPEYPWSLWIWTSDVKGAGTDAQVFLQIYGERGKSDEIKLENNSDSFEQAQLDKFMVSAGSSAHYSPF